MASTKRMMRMSMITAAVTWALAHIPLPAHASEALAKERGCLACHTTGAKLIGLPNKVSEEEAKLLVAWVLSL